MPKATKPTTSSNDAKTAAPAPAAAPAKVSKAATKAEAAPAAPAPAASTPAAAPKAKKAKAEAAPATPVPAPVVAAPAADVAAATDADASDDGLASAFSDAFAKLQQVTNLLASLKTEFRQLEKRATRELKAANKVSAKRRRKSGNRSPSGFVKPTLISPELASFLGKTAGTEMARTEVTREINAYIRKNNLQDKENGRKINPDSDLSKLLKLKAGDELTYFNLQRFMSPHFAKTKAAEAH